MSGGIFGTNWLDLSSTSNRYTRTYIQGFMDISGGNLIVRNNNLYLTQGDASINGNLILGYDASLNRRLFIGGDASLNQRLFIGGDASFGGKLFVTSDLSVNGNLYANYPANSIPSSAIIGGVGSSTFTSDISANNRIFLAGDASFGGNLFVSKNVGFGVSGSFGVYDVCNNAQMVLDISGGVNLRGPVMGGLTLPDQSVLMTATPPLDLSNNFGTVWKQATSDATRNWYSVCMSANGQHQTALVYSGYIYTSNNYGVTWTQDTSIGATKSFYSVTMSANGQYQTAVTNSNYIYTSNNYGVTWKQNTSVPQTNWRSVTMSENGQYQTAMNYNYIYTSNNYGITWTENDYASYVNDLRNWHSVTMSANGQYQTAVMYGGYIYTSNNYGVTWTKATSDAIRNWYSVTMSANGQYQTAVVADGGYIYTSNNYGVIWTQDTSIGATKSWYSVTMSANGQHQTSVVYGGYIYTSNNYGATWKQATSDATRNWYSVCMSANGQYITSVVYPGYIYTSVTPYNDLVVQNSLISYCDASFNKRLFVGSDASFATRIGFSYTTIPTFTSLHIGGEATGTNNASAVTTTTATTLYTITSLPIGVWLVEGQLYWTTGAVGRYYISINTTTAALNTAIQENIYISTASTNFPMRINTVIKVSTAANYYLIGQSSVSAAAITTGSSNFKAIRIA